MYFLKFLVKHFELVFSIIQFSNHPKFGELINLDIDFVYIVKMNFLVSSAGLPERLRGKT